MAINNTDNLEDRISNNSTQTNRTNSRRARGNRRVSMPSSNSNNNDNYKTLDEKIDDDNLDTFRDKNTSNSKAIKAALGVAATVGALAYFQNSKYGARLSEFMDFWEKHEGDLAEEDIDEAYLIIYGGFSHEDVHNDAAREYLMNNINSKEYQKFYESGKTIVKYDQMFHRFFGPMHTLFEYVL